MKKIGLILLLVCIFFSGCSQNAPIERDIFAMDTLMNIRIWGDEEDAASVCNIIYELDSLLDATQPGSDVYELNNIGTYAVREETLAILSAAIQYSERTGGSFDPTVYPLVKSWKGAMKPDVTTIEALLPSVGTAYISISGNTVSLTNNAALDFGAIGKGFAAQKCMDYLDSQGVRSAIVSLGGNVQTLGSKPDGSKWAVGISNPNSPNESIAVIRFSGSMALVTSGAYQRYYEFDGEKYHHILDPKTGFPAENDLSSVTILAQNGTMADAFSTALFVMGFDDACDFWRHSCDFEAVFILKDGTICVTEGAAPLLSECEFTVIKR